MTEQEALAAALDRSSGLDQLHPNDAFGAGFHAAIAWLRSQGEPVAYLSGMFRDVVEGKTDRIPLGADVSFINLQWRGQIPLYINPQPAIPDGWQPIETAPKDRDVLLYVARVGVVRGKWKDDHGAKPPRPYWTNDREWIFGVRATRENQPTFWMPLPAIPDQQGEAK